LEVKGIPYVNDPNALSKIKKKLLCCRQFRACPLLVANKFDYV